MKKVRIWLSTASALIIFAGGPLLSTPTRAAATEILQCTDEQQSAIFATIFEVCGDAGGSATVSCMNGVTYWGDVTCN